MSDSSLVSLTRKGIQTLEGRRGRLLGTKPFGVHASAPEPRLPESPLWLWLSIRCCADFTCDAGWKAAWASRGESRLRGAVAGPESARPAVSLKDSLSPRACVCRDWCGKPEAAHLWGMNNLFVFRMVYPFIPDRQLSPALQAAESGSGRGPAFTPGP